MTTPPTKTITRSDLARRLADGGPLVLLEALPEGYFLEGHLPTARNMPHDRVCQLAPTLLPRKDVAIVVYCASRTCRNSEVAARALADLGYEDVRVFPGGKQEWKEAGLSLEVSR
jgi:rhodanese-related sulfurtransferase